MVVVSTNGRNGKQPANPDEYDRFEDLAKKLVRVPKSEIDRKRKEAEQTR